MGGVAAALAYSLAVGVGNAPDAAAALIFPLAALGLVWLIVFVYHLISAPVAAMSAVARARDEAREERDARERQRAELEATVGQLRSDLEAARTDAAQQEAARGEAVEECAQAYGEMEKLDRQCAELRSELDAARAEAEARAAELRAEIERVGRVTADIDHVKGCPRDPARLESYPLTREDGIRVMVGRCMECGVCAYRHGDVPEPTKGDRAPTPVEELSAVLGEARGVLRERLLLESAGHWEEDGEFVEHPPVPPSEDPLYLWARKALKVVAAHFSEYADEFHGGEGDMPDSRFMMAFCEESKHDRFGYLEKRIALLARVLERVR